MNVMKRKFLILVISATTIFTFFSLTTLASANWKHLDMKTLRYAYKQKVIKYDPVNWGSYDSDRHNIFKDTKHVQYRYSNRNRIMIMRYRNSEKYLRVSYNYRKLVFRGNHKHPVVTFYSKVGHEKWQYINTIKFWLVKPIQY